MDAEAVSAALSPEALAPPIAKTLGLPADAVQVALQQLAAGDQPAFLVHYRADKIKGLTIRDLERIQAQAARSAAFEFKRQEVAVEMLKRRLTSEFLAAHLRSADHPVDLEDIRSLMRRRKRGPAARAKAAGLNPAAAALWVHGSKGVLAELMADRTKVEPPPEALPPEPAQTEASAPTPEVPATPEPEAASEAPAQAPAGATPESSEGESVEAAPAGAETPAETPAPEASKPEPVESYDIAAIVQAIEAGQELTEASVLKGLSAICGEHMTEHPPLRRRLRRLAMGSGKLKSEVVPEKKDKGARYSKYFDRSEACGGAAASNILALHRGEREGVLRVDIDVDTDKVVDAIVEELAIDRESAAGKVLVTAAKEAWEHSLGKVIKGGIRKLLKERADRDAVAEFTEALRPLLLAPAFGPKPVMSIDGGHQNGCRVAVLGSDGELIDQDTVFPLQPKQQVPQTKARLLELAKQHGIKGITVGATPAGREVERICRQLVRESAEELPDVIVTSVDSDAAALYASSKQAREEFPEGDAALRRAVAVGRRVQDPLSELIKVDPRKLGLGQYQHEVDQEELRNALEQVTTYCVSRVTVDVNTVDAEHLARVAGLSHALAKALVSHREANGPFKTRSALMDVPGLAGKAFEQSAGFLRILDGEQPLDATTIHPERYPHITQMARDLGVIVPDLLRNTELLDKVDRSTLLGQPGVSGEPLGEQALDQILAELANPGADPRPEFEAIEFNPDLSGFDDLKVGMELEGLVTHLAAFGAFVDVGLEHDGLVHVSELSHEFISNPLDAVHVGQKVKGKVIEVTPEKKRFSLSLKALMPRPAGAPGRRKDSKPGKGKRKEGKGRPRGKEGKGKPQRKERTLGFRMDLSDLASLLDKG
jgi:uncharacterized protein